MEPNPYESPPETATEVTPPAAVGRMIGVWEIAMIVGPLVLVAVAATHRLQLDNGDAYRNSGLIFFEVMGVLAGYIFLPLAFGRSLLFLFAKLPQYAAVNLALAAWVLIGTLMAQWIDAPTLIYGT